MKFTEKLNTLIKEKNMNRKSFSEDASISYSTIDNWYKRGYDNMSIATLRTLCDYFNVTMDSMAYDDREIEYRTDKHDTLPQDALKLARDYAKLDDRGRNAVSDTIQRELSYSYTEKEASLLA